MRIFADKCPSYRLRDGVCQKPNSVKITMKFFVGTFIKFFPFVLTAVI